MYDIFQGIYKERIICPHCKKVIMLNLWSEKEEAMKHCNDIFIEPTEATP